MNVKNCKTCKNCNLKKNICDADMWNRNAENEIWLHSDEDFKVYIEKARFCTEREPT